MFTLNENILINIIKQKSKRLLNYPTFKKKSLFYLKSDNEYFIIIFYLIKNNFLCKMVKVERKFINNSKSIIKEKN